MAAFQYYPSKIATLSVPGGSFLLKSGTHIQVAVSYVYTILGSPLINYAGYIGIMCYCLLGFIGKFKEKLGHFVSLAIMCFVSHDYD